MKGPWLISPERPIRQIPTEANKGATISLNKSNKLAILAYLIVCIVWGSTYLAIRIAVTDMPFLSFAGIRFISAGAIILTVSLLKGWAFPSGWPEYRTSIIAGAMLLFISNGLICWAEQWIDSGLTALLVASVPLFMALIEVIFPGDHRLGWLGWVGLVIGFCGVAFLVSPNLTLAGNTLPAMLAVLAASLNWAAASIYLKRKTISGSMLPNVGIQMFSAGAAFLIAAAVSGGISIAGASASGIGALLYLIFIGSILAYSAFYYMLKVIPAAKAGTYAYINPIVAVILGALILKEVVTAQTVVAASIILTGVVLVQLAKVKPVSRKILPQTALKT